MESLNAKDASFEMVEIYGLPALFTPFQIEQNSIPLVYRRYNLRHNDSNETLLCIPETHLDFNSIGSIIINQDIIFEPELHTKIEPGDFTFTPEPINNLQDYMNAYRPVNRKSQFNKLYFNDGKIWECKKFTHLAEKDGSYTVMFSSGRYHILADSNYMGSFLPDVASAGMEITAIDDPRMKQFYPPPQRKRSRARDEPER